MISPATSSRITSGFISIIAATEGLQLSVWNHCGLTKSTFGISNTVTCCQYNIIAIVFTETAHLMCTTQWKKKYIYIYIFRWSKELYDADDVSFLFF